MDAATAGPLPVADSSVWLCRPGGHSRPHSTPTAQSMWPSKGRRHGPGITYVCHREEQGWVGQGYASVLLVTHLPVPLPSSPSLTVPSSLRQTLPPPWAPLIWLITLSLETWDSPPTHWPPSSLPPLQCPCPLALQPPLPYPPLSSAFLGSSLLPSSRLPPAGAPTHTGLQPTTPGRAGLYSPFQHRAHISPSAPHSQALPSPLSGLVTPALVTSPSSHP